MTENLNDLNPLFSKVWMSDDDKILFGVGLKLEDRLDGKALVGESDDRLFPTDGVIIDPSVEASRIRAVVVVGDKGAEEVNSFLFAIFDVDLDVSEVDVSILGGRQSDKI